MAQINSRLKVCLFGLLLGFFLSFAIFEVAQTGGHDLLLKWFRNQSPNDAAQMASVAQVSKMREPVQTARLATSINSTWQSDFSAESPHADSRIHLSDATPGAPALLEIPPLEGEPMLVIEPKELNVSLPWKGIVQQTLTITNSSNRNQKIKLSVSHETSWLAVAPASTTLAPSSQFVATVTFDANSLEAAGKYHVTLQLETSEKPVRVPVKLTVQPAQKQQLVVEAREESQTSRLAGSGSFPRQRPESESAIQGSFATGNSDGNSSESNRSRSNSRSTKSSSDDHGNDINTGTKIRLGDMVEGMIAPEDDIDYFVFDAKRGDIISLEIQSRRLRVGSRLDSYITLYGPNGERLRSNDDSWDGRGDGGGYSLDSSISNYQVPSAGKYALSVKDLGNRGGADYGYVLISSRL